MAEHSNEPRKLQQALYSINLLKTSAGSVTKALADVEKTLQGAEQQNQETESKLTRQNDELEKIRDELKAAREENDALKKQQDDAIRNATGEMQREVDSLRNQVKQAERNENVLNSNWTAALTAVLTSEATGEDIDPESLAPILPTYLQRVDDFRVVASDSFRFPDLVEVPFVAQPDLTIKDLLLWNKHISVPEHLANVDQLTRVVWLQEGLLEKIKTKKLRGTWLLLAFELLFNLAKEESGLTRCVLYVQLASLSSQYRMEHSQIWRRMVFDLIQNHAQLNMDRLSKACLAHLALTTNDPAGLTETLGLGQAYNNGFIHMSVTIPEIIKLFPDHPSPDSDHATLQNVQVVVVRQNDQEIVFSKSLSRDVWACSTSGLKFKKTAGPTVEMTWGAPESLRVIWGEGAMAGYLRRHHGNAFKRAIDDDNRELRERLQKKKFVFRSLS